MSRVTGDIVTRDQSDIGRMVFTGNLIGTYDSSTCELEWQVPSRSRRDRVYVVRCSAVTGEIHCPCEDYEYRKDTKKGARDYAVYLESLVKARRGVILRPLVTRPPSGLCIHARACRRWLMRHHLIDPIRASIEYWERKTEALPQRQTA